MLHFDIQYIDHVLHILIVILRVRIIRLAILTVPKSTTEPNAQQREN